MRKYLLTAGLSAALVLAGSAGSADAANPRVVVYVTSQDLCYVSVVAPNSLPNKGPFQTLTPGGPCTGGMTFTTEFGPGDRGYVGGRWEMMTADGIKRFSCPLVEPGYAPPSP
jgi:hypothetical protein